MIKQEFEKLAGYEVSDHDYDVIIEPMYMATELSKMDFINCLDRKRFEVQREKSEDQIRLEADLKEEMKMLKDEIARYSRQIQQYSQYLTDPDWEFWKRQIKEYKEFIKRDKCRIREIKFVLRA